MSPVILAAGASVVILVGSIALFGFGHRLGVRREASDPEGGRDGLGAIETATFGLMGLLLAFTFSGAAQRFEGRRALVTAEANALGTAWQRLDLLPDASRAVVREDLREYADARLAMYATMPDLEASQAESKRADALARAVWAGVVEFCKTSDGARFAPVLLPPMNEAFDLAATRTAATMNHPPTIVFVMLAALILLSSLLAGYATAKARRPSRLHAFAFAALLSTTFYVILDIEYPRIGLIRVDQADRLLEAVRDGMR